MIQASLAEFHRHKAAILSAGARVGKGNKPTDNWYIPKLELMQSVEPSIRHVGAIIQWSADLTKHAHITEVKNPARSTNNQGYDAQICRFLDRRDKCRCFAVATSIRECLGAQHLTSAREDVDEEQSDDEHDGDAKDNERGDGYEPDLGPSRVVTDYFSVAKRLDCGMVQGARRPYRTFSIASMAFHLSRDPSGNMSIDEVAAKYHLPDLRCALADFLRCVQMGRVDTLAIGGRRMAAESSQLPFDRLQVWEKLRVQQKSYHNSEQVTRACTLHASPPSTNFPVGCYDTAIVNSDQDYHWPSSGLNGALRLDLCYSDSTANVLLLRSLHSSDSPNLATCVEHSTDSWA
jgi:hypothetical protein